MNKPPPKRGGKPPRRESAPREHSVYRHPDAQAQVPPEKPSPWKREERGARPGPATSRSDSTRGKPSDSGGPRQAPGSRDPRSEGSGPYGRGPRAEGHSPYGRGPRRESDTAGGRPERGERAPTAARPWANPATELVTPVDDRDAQRKREVRIYGRAACLALAEDRFEGIRKLYCTRQRGRELSPLLARLAAARIGFNEVEEADLERLTASQHHEGVAMDVLRLEQPSLSELLDALARQSGPACLVALAGVGNPHNFGAILRSAVHFGARAVLIPADSALTLAGAVYRVAEGAAERVPVVRFPELGALRTAGFELVATASQGERSLYRDALPARSILLFGAEGAGLSAHALELADARYAIPGSGRVDSLNVAQAVAVVLGEWWRGARVG
ncbi:MAG: TrmH family RNA methyltransferase [Lysobacterales bacterium]